MHSGPGLDFGQVPVPDKNTCSHCSAIHNLAKLVSRGKEFSQFLFDSGGSNGGVKGRANLERVLPFTRHDQLGLESQLVPARLRAALQVVKKLIGAEIATNQREL